MNYDKRPYVQISSRDADCDVGCSQIVAAIQSIRPSQSIALECYPGVLLEPLLNNLLPALSPAVVIQSESCFMSPCDLQRKFAAQLTEDPVFGHMHPWELEDFFDPDRLRTAKEQCRSSTPGL